MHRSMLLRQTTSSAAKSIATIALSSQQWALNWRELPIEVSKIARNYRYKETVTICEILLYDSARLSFSSNHVSIMSARSRHYALYLGYFLPWGFTSCSDERKSFRSTTHGGRRPLSLHFWIIKHAFLLFWTTSYLDPQHWSFIDGQSLAFTQFHQYFAISLLCSDIGRGLSTGRTVNYQRRHGYKTSPGLRCRNISLYIPSCHHQGCKLIRIHINVSKISMNVDVTDLWSTRLVYTCQQKLSSFDISSNWSMRCCITWIPDLLTQFQMARTAWNAQKAAGKRAPKKSLANLNARERRRGGYSSAVKTERRYKSDSKLLLIFVLIAIPKRIANSLQR